MGLFLYFLQVEFTFTFRIMDVKLSFEYSIFLTLCNTFEFESNFCKNYSLECNIGRVCCIECQIAFTYSSIHFHFLKHGLISIPPTALINFFGNFVHFWQIS